MKKIIYMDLLPPTQTLFAMARLLHGYDVSKLMNAQLRPQKLLSEPGRVQVVRWQASMKRHNLSPYGPMECGRYGLILT